MIQDNRRTQRADSDTAEKFKVTFIYSESAEMSADSCTYVQEKIDKR